MYGGNWYSTRSMKETGYLSDLETTECTETEDVTAAGIYILLI
jgi:hypothetical protein